MDTKPGQVGLDAEQPALSSLPVVANLAAGDDAPATRTETRVLGAGCFLTGKLDCLAAPVRAPGAADVAAHVQARPTEGWFGNANLRRRLDRQVGRRPVGNPTRRKCNCADKQRNKRPP